MSIRADVSGAKVQNSKCPKEQMSQVQMSKIANVPGANVSGANGKEQTERSKCHATGWEPISKLVGHPQCAIFLESLCPGLSFGIVFKIRCRRSSSRNFFLNFFGAASP